MSNIYVLEPPTAGKVLLKTTVGDIDIELWSKETPKTARNFIQLCMEGYYNNTIFHRVVKDFIVQGGDPNGDGSGGESIYGEPFKDEFHQRLRFTRRGLVAMANAGKDDNGSQFFFTLGATPELQNVHTLFGKVTGETVFNMLKLSEGLIHDERPEYPHKILKAEILYNPFPDIEPRVKEVQVKESKKKEKKAGVKNFKLLSFGEEAEEDEEESTRENVKFVGKGKSTHDVLDDPKLSKQIDEMDENDDAEIDSEDEEAVKAQKLEQLENIRKKLKTSHKKQPSTSKPVVSATTVIDDDDKIFEDYLNRDQDEERKKKVLEIKSEIENVKKEYHKNKLKKEEEKKTENKKETFKNETLKEYQEQFDKYKEKKELHLKKGAEREKFTLQLLDKFKKRLHSAKGDDEEEDSNVQNESAENEWLTHRLQFTQDAPILAKDANTKDDDWYDINDPRNKLNKRRRGEETSKK